MATNVNDTLPAAFIDEFGKMRTDLRTMQAEIRELRRQGPHPKKVLGGFSIKSQELTDKNTGVTIAFGSHGDDSDTVWCRVTVPGAPPAALDWPNDPAGRPLISTILFHRDGEVLSVSKHATGVPEVAGGDQRDEWEQIAEEMSENELLRGLHDGDLGGTQAGPPYGDSHRVDSGEEPVEVTHTSDGVPLMPLPSAKRPAKV